MKTLDGEVQSLVSGIVSLLGSTKGSSLFASGKVLAGKGEAKGKTGEEKGKKDVWRGLLTYVVLRGRCVPWYISS